MGKLLGALECLGELVAKPADVAGGQRIGVGTDDENDGFPVRLDGEGAIIDEFLDQE